MWLQNNNSQQGDNIQSSSSFDITDNNEKQPQYFIDNMITPQPLPIFDVLEIQLKTHLHISSSSSQISEHGFEEIENFSDNYREFYQGSNNEFDEYITTTPLTYQEDAIDTIVRAASKSFVCKIVLFSEENTEHRIIEAKNLPNIPNIYLPKTPGKFLSLTFKTEDVAL